MRSSIKFISISIILLLALSGCQVVKLFQPTSTPIPPTQTPTSTSTPTETPIPTATSTPLPTFTPTPAVITVEAYSDVEVPILLYHHVTDTIQDSRYNIAPEKFEEQIKWLYDNGYQTINITTLAILILEGGQLPLRPVIITFDDGNLDVYQNAFPILQKYDFIATFYIVDQYINGTDMISIDQVKELAQAGWEIGSHSNTHVHLNAPNVDLQQEIRMAKMETEEKLGVTIHSFAYPFGEINDEVIAKTSRFGYSSAVGLGSSYTHNLSSIYYLSRIEIENDFDMQKFISLLPWSGPIQ